MFAITVQDAEYNDPVVFHAIKEFERKTAGEHPAKITVIERPTFRINSQLMDG